MSTVRTAHRYVLRLRLILYQRATDGRRRRRKTLGIVEARANNGAEIPRCLEAGKSLMVTTVSDYTVKYVVL